MDEKEVMEKTFKLSVFDSFSYEKLKQVCDRVCELGYTCEFINNGNIVFTEKAQDKFKDMWHCGYCGKLHEENVKGTLCDCGSEAEDYDKVKYNVTQDIVFVNNEDKFLGMSSAGINKLKRTIDKEYPFKTKKLKELIKENENDGKK